MTGERDLRSEDRQLLLDAIMAAQDALVICYTGADEHTGAPRPPAVPLDEVLDAVSRTAGEVPAEVRAQVLTRHPLQPYDARNFHADGPAESAAPTFSFDRTAEAGALAALGERHVGPILPVDAADAAEHKAPAADLNLADLKAFFAHPVRAFLRNRLQIGVPLEQEETLNAIPIELDALAKWDVGDRLLREVVAGRDPVGLMTAEQLRGTLPPGQLGDVDFRRITTEVQALVNQTDALRDGTPRTIDVSIELGNGRLLTGTVAGVFGTRIVSVGYSSLRAKQRSDVVAGSARSDGGVSRRALDRARGRQGPRRAHPRSCRTAR